MTTVASERPVPRGLLAWAAATDHKRVGVLTGATAQFGEAVLIDFGLSKVPVKELSPKGRLVLVVRDPDGKDVTRFTIDLASMR